MKHILLALSLSLSLAPLAADEQPLKVTTLDGKTYEGKVTRVEASGIVLMHAGGIARIDFENLPGDIQGKFGYDAERASRQRDEMARNDAARQAALTAQREASAKKQADAKLLESAERRTYKVLSVIEGQGVLANEYTRGGYGGRLASAISSISGGPSSVYVEPTIGDLVFLAGEMPVLVDDDVFDAMVVPDGVFKYETTLGSVSTVKKFRALEAKADK